MKKRGRISPIIKWPGIIIIFMIIIYFILNRVSPSIFNVTLYQITEAYLSFLEKGANFVLTLVTETTRIFEHKVYQGSNLFTSFVPEIRYKKVLFIFIILIIITRSELWKKFLFIFLLFAIHIIFNSFYIASGGFLSTLVYFDKSYLSIPDTLALLSLFLVLILWLRKNSESIFNALSRLKIRTDFLSKKSNTIYILVLLYILVTRFFLEFFDYEPWINFLFRSARNILIISGWNAEVEPFHLIGENGSIYMAKFCLGFKTMFLFASIVFLTGEKNITRWLYIVSGLIFLNIVNILRFVFLFIHIQKHRGYILPIDIHDLYNYITYTIVFLMWVLWFEKYSEIRKKNYKKPQQVMD